MQTAEIALLLILIVFYSSFFIKMIWLKRQRIDSNLLGKGEKSEKSRLVERMLKAVTYSGGAIQFLSVFFFSENRGAIGFAAA